MLDSIREIGLFMIAAQAVIHFAPGRQYEKYIKLISSVIILFLFIRPFISVQGELEQEWQAGMEQIMQDYEAEDLWQAAGRGADDMAVEQLEKEIKSTFNQAIAGEVYYVSTVSLIFEESDSSWTGGDESGLQFEKVVVVMAPKEEGTITPVLIEDIVIEEERRQEKEDTASKYQEIFAKILGIVPDGVEVTCVGGW